jgi:alcohol dehydrogenase class IV
MTYTRPVTLHLPKKLVVGAGCLSQMVDDCLAAGYKRLFVLTVPVVAEMVKPVFNKLQGNGIELKINTSINAEPYYADFEKVLSEARAFNADCVAGIGGGSVMDVAKLIAAQLYNTQTLNEIAGNGLLKERRTYLICVPTTSGTGSEVSPNAILSNNDGVKTGIISPFLVPDASYIDAELAVGLPPAVTAFTGMDALTHCIEAYANKFAHPLVDMYALEGVRLIASNLKIAYDNGKDIEARSRIALGSVYGGMCLGPVNTAAVHALAYPLGSDFKMAHGLSNAILLPYVIEYNIDAAENRYADIAIALGAKPTASAKETALAGVAIIRDLNKHCNIPSSLSETGISKEALPELAKAASNVQRLLKNNVKAFSLDDIVNVFTNAFSQIWI